MISKNFPQKVLNTTKFRRPDSPIAVGIFGILLLGQLVLPLFPVWSELLRVIGFWVLYRHIQTIKGIMAFVLMAATWTGASLSAIGFSFEGIFYHIYYSILGINGAQLHWPVGMVLQIVDIYLIVQLVRISGQRWKNSQSKLVRVFFVSTLLFWAVLYVPTLKLGMTQVLTFSEVVQVGQQTALNVADQVQKRQLEKKLRVLQDKSQTQTIRLEKQLAGLKRWNCWFLILFMGLIILRTNRDMRFVLMIFVVATGFQSTIVLVEHLLGDYSYILESREWGNYFFRVKGTYYYHGAVSLFLLLGLFFTLSASEYGVSPKLIVPTLTVCILAVYLNSTRAISIGVVAGFLTYVFSFWGRKIHGLHLGFAVFIPLLFLTTIFYEKQDVEVQPIDTDSPATAISQLAQSNLSRLELLTIAVKNILDSPFMGQGIGTINLPLNGRILGGEVNTYSSHSLFMDVPLMAGIQGGGLFFVLFALVGVMWGRHWANPAWGSEWKGMAGGMLGFLAAFGVTGMFFPQERNYIISVFFIAAIIGVIPLLQGKLSRSSLCHDVWTFGWVKRGIMCILSLGLFWAMAFSSSYFFPVAEFLYRYLNSTGKLVTDKIYTNSSALQQMIRTGLILFTPEQVPVLLLKDNPYTLPSSRSWLLWNPAYDSAYPRLRQQLGYVESRPYGLTPSFFLPRYWQVIPSMQSTVSIIRIGYSQFPPIWPEDIGKVRLNGQNLSPLLTLRKPHPAQPRASAVFSFGPDQPGTWEFEANTFTFPDINEIEMTLYFSSAGTVQIKGQSIVKSGIEYFPIQNVNSRGGARKVKFVWNGRSTRHIRLLFTATTQIEKASIKFYGIFLPNFGRFLKISEKGHANLSTPFLADGRHTTAWISAQDGGTDLLLEDEFGGQEPMVMYRMSGIHFRDAEAVSPSQWLLEGSSDMKHWKVLDQRSNVVLPGGPREFQSFWVQNPSLVRYYRFRFNEDPEELGQRIGLTELELYPRGDSQLVSGKK